MNPQQNQGAGGHDLPAQQPILPAPAANPGNVAGLRATARQAQASLSAWPEDWREQLIEMYGAHTTTIIAQFKDTIAQANRVTKENKFLRIMSSAAEQVRAVRAIYPNHDFQSIKWAGDAAGQRDVPEAAPAKVQGPQLKAKPGQPLKGRGIMDDRFIAHQANRVEPAVIKRAADAPIIRAAGGKDAPAVVVAAPVKDIAPGPQAPIHPGPRVLNARQRRNALRLAGLKARVRVDGRPPAAQAPAAVVPVNPPAVVVPQDGAVAPVVVAQAKQVVVPAPAVGPAVAAAPAPPVAGVAKLSRRQRKLANRAQGALPANAAAAAPVAAAKPKAPAAPVAAAVVPAVLQPAPPKAKGNKGLGPGKQQAPGPAAIVVADGGAAAGAAPAAPAPVKSSPPKDAVYTRVLRHNLPSNFVATVHDGETFSKQEGVPCCSGKNTILWAEDRPGYTQSGKYATVLNSYIPVVKVATQALRDRVCAFNFDFAMTRALTGENPHALSAAVRSLFTARALARLSQSCEKIVSCYASQRELSIHLHATPLVRGPMPNLSLYIPNVTADDLKRRATISDPSHITDMIIGDGLLFVDVYHLGPEAFDQSNLHRLMVRAGATKAIWIGHRYTGHFGSTFNEGIWAMTSPGTITSYPDMESPAYPAHPALSWMWHEQGDQLSWTIVTSASTYVMVEFTRSVGAVQSMHRAIEPDYHTVSVIKTGNVLTHAATVFVLRHVPLGRHLVQKMQVHVPTKIWSVIEQHFAQRPISQYTLSSATLASSNIATMIPMWRELSLKFPGLVTSAMEDYTRAYLESTTIDRARRWDVTYNTCNAAAAHMNQTRQNFGVTQDRTWKPAFGLMLLLVLLGMLGPKVVRFLVRIIRIQPYSKWSIFPNAPNFSAIAEELVRHFCGSLTLGGLEIAAGLTRAVTYCRDWRNRRFAYTEMLRTVDAVAGHYALAGTPLGLALPVHLIANGLDMPGVGLCVLAATSLKRIYDTMWPRTLDPPSSGFADDYTAHVNDGDVIQESFELRGYENSAIKVETPRRAAPTSIKPVEAGTVMINNVALDPDTTANPLPARNDCPPWFNLIQLAVPFYAPANGPAELLSMITSRITVLPKFQKTDMQRKAVADLWRHKQSEAVTVEIWGDAKSRGTQIYHDVIERIALRSDCAVPGFELLLAQWFDDLPASKKKAYKQSLELLQKGREPPRSTKLMIKADEVLCKFAEDGSVEFKPRPIAVVDPMVVVRTGPYIKWATEKLKDLFYDYSTPTVSLKTTRKDNYRPDTFSITCNFACGWDADDLNQWMRYVLLANCDDMARWWIIASGDDSLVVYKFGDDCLFLEADASKYDRSQTAGLLDHEYSLLTALNVPFQVTDLLRKTASQPYRCVYHDTEIVVTREAFRDTGGADTTFGNTANMLAAWVAVIAAVQHDPSKEAVMSVFERLGLEMKLDIHQYVDDVTFLKGRWWRLQDENLDNMTHAWGPLESRLVKIVKSMRAPWTMGVKGSRVQCMAAFLACQAISLSQFTCGPVLEHFIHIWRSRKLTEEMQVAIALNERRVHHKVGAGKTVYTPDIDAASQHLADRYNITEADLREFYETFPETCPARWSGRLATALATRDYA